MEELPDSLQAIILAVLVALALIILVKSVRIVSQATVELLRLLERGLGGGRGRGEE